MRQRPIMKQYRFQTASYVYSGCKRERRGKGLISTAGSSTTITSTNNAFQAVVVGDEIKVVYAGSTYRRYVTAKASYNSITVSAIPTAAIDLPSAVTWHHHPQRSGATDADGWVNVQHLKDKLLYIQMDATASGAGITYSVEAKGDEDNAVPRQLITGTLTAAVVVGTTNPAAADTVVIAERIVAVRVGVKNDAGGVDIVSAWITGKETA